MGSRHYLERIRAHRWSLTCYALLAFVLVVSTQEFLESLKQVASEDSVTLVEEEFRRLRPHIGDRNVVGIAVVTFFAKRVDELATLLQNPVHRTACLMQFRIWHEAKITALAYAAAPCSGLLVVLGEPGARYTLESENAEGHAAIAVEARYPGSEWAVGHLSPPKRVILYFDTQEALELRMGGRTFRSAVTGQVAELRETFLRRLVEKGRSALGERFKVIHDTGTGLVLLELEPVR